jgi:hypothetical protein
MAQPQFLTVKSDVTQMEYLTVRFEASGHIYSKTTQGDTEWYLSDLEEWEIASVEIMPMVEIKNDTDTAGVIVHKRPMRA